MSRRNCRVSCGSTKFENRGWAIFYAVLLGTAAFVGGILEAPRSSTGAVLLAIPFAFFSLLSCMLAVCAAPVPMITRGPAEEPDEVTALTGSTRRHKWCGGTPTQRLVGHGAAFTLTVALGLAGWSALLPDDAEAALITGIMTGIIGLGFFISATVGAPVLVIPCEPACLPARQSADRQYSYPYGRA